MQLHALAQFKRVIYCSDFRNGFFKLYNKCLQPTYFNITDMRGSAALCNRAKKVGTPQYVHQFVAVSKGNMKSFTFYS
jgi:hypothetical protein